MILEHGERGSRRVQALGIGIGIGVEVRNLYLQLVRANAKNLPKMGDVRVRGNCKGGEVEREKVVVEGR